MALLGRVLHFRSWPLAAYVLAFVLLTLGASQVEAQGGGLGTMRKGLDAHFIDRKTLNQAQPALIEKAVKAMGKPRKGQPQIYVLSIGAGGSQALFGREAAAVQGMFASRLGAKSPSIVLSNARKDLFQLPIASRDNVSAVLGAIGKRMNPDKDLLLFYITAHGSPDAFVQTDLPDGTWLDPISADFLGDALDKAGIKRRILIISACFSGSWIPRLESETSIVLTASTPYRPSFGCDDRNEFTHYGTALIKGGLGRGLSWSEAYAELQVTITRQERAMRVPASGPMADVGEAMKPLWNAPLAPLPRR